MGLQLPSPHLNDFVIPDDFGWLQRIKVALGFARLLEFLTDNGAEYLVRKIDATQVMIDQVLICVSVVQYLLCFHIFYACFSNFHRYRSSFGVRTITPCYLNLYH